MRRLTIQIILTAMACTALFIGIGCFTINEHTDNPPVRPSNSKVSKKEQWVGMTKTTSDKWNKVAKSDTDHLQGYHPIATKENNKMIIFKCRKQDSSKNRLITFNKTNSTLQIVSIQVEQ